MTPNDILTAAAVAGAFLWIGAALTTWFFCVHSMARQMREAMKIAFIVIYLRLTAATLGDMPLDYFGAMAYVLGALVGAAVLVHHLRRIFRYGDRCSVGG